MRVSKPLTDALYGVLLDAAPWWMKVTKAQRFRLEIIATEAAHVVEQMREEG